MIDVKNVHHLVALFEAGTVTGAAEALHLSQPTLTSHLGRLESLLGERLFLRSARGLEPTPTGKFFYKKGKAMLAQWRTFDREMKLLAGAEVGEMRILCGAGIAEGILPRAIARFLDSRRGVRLTADVINPERMQEILLQGNAEIAVGAFAELPAPDIERIDAGPLPVCFFARPQHPLLSAGEITDLNDCLFALPEIPAGILDWMQKRGFNVGNHHLVSDSFSMLKQVAMESDLLVGGPQFIFAQELRAGTLMPLPLDDPPRWQPSILISPAARYSRIVRAMAQHIEQELSACITA